MRTVFIFPGGERAATTATLDRLCDGQAGYWTASKLYINLENERGASCWPAGNPTTSAVWKLLSAPAPPGPGRSTSPAASMADRTRDQ